MKFHSEVDRKRQEEALKNAEAEIKVIREIISIATSTEEGIIFARYLMNQCGFQRPSVVANQQTGEININSTIYMEARRNIWLDLRKMIPIKTLKKIEFEKTNLRGDENE
jgi:hypothetical protein